MTAISINIGLNRVDPNHYNGWSGQLQACENDARDMQAIATSRGYSTILLLNQDATSARVLEALAKAARTLKAGDMLLFTYSGHGGQVPAINRDEEDDGLDETWVLYDRMLIDNELFGMWSQFAAGVHIFMLSDSCHSGTVSRDSPFANFTSKDLMPLLSKFKIDEASIPRVIPSDVAQTTYLQHRNMYESLQWSNLKENRSTIGAGVILISGCQDNQTSADGFLNGYFTATLLSIWNNGAFSGNYPTFHQKILAVMPAVQAPKYFKVGLVDTAFESMTPFTTQTSQKNSTKVIPMNTIDINEIIKKLNNNDVQMRILNAARAAVLTQLEEEGIELTPEILAEINARATSRSPEGETLVAAAILIATISVFSDKRLKENIKRIGASDSGIGIYEFSYKGFSNRWRGVMAQELLKSHPTAVSRHENGFLMVNYGKIDVVFCAA